MGKHLRICTTAAALIAIAAPGTMVRADEGMSGLSEEQGLEQLVFGESRLTDGRSIDEAELSELRGGYGGVYFELFGFGNIGQVGGTLPDGVEVTSQSADLVSLNVGLASLPNTGGFVQFASVVGNNNIVNNNLVLNVYFLEGGVADTSNITNGGIFGF